MASLVVVKVQQAPANNPDFSMGKTRLFHLLLRLLLGKIRTYIAEIHAMTS